MGKINVGNLEGNFPNYRITLHEDSEMAVDSQLIIQNQQYMPLPSNTTEAFAAATQSFRQGQVRWNTTINDLEVFTGTAWVSRTSIGG